MAVGTRSYHHGDLRAALIAAGLELARRNGTEGLGLREITRRVGVSPNAAYRHFSDRRAIVLAVAHEAQIRLARSIREGMDAVPSSLDPAERARQRLRRFGLGYIDFALSETGWFEMACESQHVPDDAVPVLSAKDPTPAPYLQLIDALDEIVDAGGLAEHRREGAEWVCWAGFDGFADLVTTGPLQGRDRETVKFLAERLVDTIIDGLGDHQSG